MIHSTQWLPLKISGGVLALSSSKVEHNTLVKFAGRSRKLTRTTMSFNNFLE